MNRLTGEKLSHEQAHIRQSIQDILLTPQGSRLQRREYGSQLFALLDRPLSKALALQIAGASVMALKRWEPRIEVQRFQVKLNPQLPQVWLADLDIVEKQGRQRFTFNDLPLRAKYEPIS